MLVKIKTGDVLEMKKKHPCGSQRFVVRFAGSDIKMICSGCGRELLLPRVRVEKMIRTVLEKAEND